MSDYIKINGVLLSDCPLKAFHGTCAADKIYCHRECRFSLIETHVPEWCPLLKGKITVEHIPGK